MNPRATSVSEPSLQAQGFAPAGWSTFRPFYWSIRRELWENRWIYIAPIAAGALFLVGFAASIVRQRLHLHDLSWAFGQTHHGSDQYELASALIMGTAIIVSVFYCLDALYGERRDRSILFWKSLPVSDVTAVVAKLAIPILVLPLLSFVITVATQFLMLVISSVIFAGSGVNIAELWRQASFFRVPAIWLYHLVTVHGLWYAPLYAWLLLVSAWAPRAPFLWAFLPPFVIYGVEKIAFNSSYFLNMLQYRLTGSSGGMAPEHTHQDFAASLIPQHFFSEPGLWIGLAIAAAFLFAAVRLRRYRGPI
jgi:ABC-2 type transport system permease protein